MKQKILFGFTIVCYAIILFALVFLKDNIRALNLIPFGFIKDYIVDKQPLGMANIIGNILMFIPMGIFLSMIGQRYDKVLIFLIGSSACIEVLQYVLFRGVSDIDDIILNCVGGLIGIGCYKISKTWGNKSDTIMLVLVLCALIFIIALYLCLHFGVLGFRIRIF
ncbi:MAG: VanZ family protein [Clostridiales bacterium]|nr:VanZ family protein [Clostridiales bacterium]